MAYYETYYNQQNIERAEACATNSKWSASEMDIAMDFEGGAMAMDINTDLWSSSAKQLDGCKGKDLCGWYSDPTDEARTNEMMIENRGKPEDVLATFGEEGDDMAFLDELDHIMGPIDLLMDGNVFQNPDDLMLYDGAGGGGGASIDVTPFSAPAKPQPVFNFEPVIKMTSAPRIRLDEPISLPLSQDVASEAASEGIVDSESECESEGPSDGDASAKQGGSEEAEVAPYVYPGRREPLGQDLPNRGRHLCRISGCSQDARWPDYVCGKHGGGKCQHMWWDTNIEPCTSFHQSKNSQGELLCGRHSRMTGALYGDNARNKGSKSTRSKGGRKKK